jgi:hypothetical protein
MAYGAVKFTEFTDNCDIDWKIQIYQKDHSGANTSFTTGPTGFDLQYKGERFDDKMKSSEITFSFFSTSSGDDTFLTNLSTDLPSTYLVEVFRDTAGTNSTYWKGIIQTSNIQIKDTFYPQEYKLRAICGLQLLKSTTTLGLSNLIKGGYSDKYTLDTSDVQTITFGSIITSSLSTLATEELFTTSETFVRRRGCWNATGMDAYPNDTWHEIGYLSKNLYEEKNSTTTTTFEFKKCFEVIEEILDLMNARLYQEDGIWRLEQLGIFNDINNLSTPPRYYRIAKDSDQLGSGNGNAVTTDITATNSQFIKSAGMLTGFSEVIRRIETKIEGVDDFDQDFIEYYQNNLPADPTPIAADFINSNLSRTNTNQFIKLEFSWRANNLTGALLPNAPLDEYHIPVNCFIKCGTNYLQTDLDSTSSTYGQKIWDTAANPYIPTDVLVQAYGAPLLTFLSGTDSYNINPIYYIGFNPPTSNAQFQIPSDDIIELYFYYRVIKTPQGQISSIDDTASFSSSDFEVNLQPSYPNIFGFKLSIVDENGSYIKQTKFTSINSPSGTEVEGGNIIEETINFENTQIQTSARFILFKNSSGQWVSNLYSWNNVLQVVGTGTDLTRLRQKEKIAMQSNSLDLIRGTLLKRDLRQLGLSNDGTTLLLHKPIYIGTKLYLIVGFNLSAVSGAYDVTLQELEYNFAAVALGTDLFALLMENLTETWTGAPVNFFNL